MSDLKERIEKSINNKEYQLAINDLDLALKNNPENKELLLIRGDLFYNLQRYSDALNDYNKVLRIESENKIVSSKVEMIKDILKFQNLDIYAATNLNLDPWLD